MSTRHPTDAIDEALARAVVYRTLSIGFQLPTKARLDQIGARDGFHAVEAALEHLNQHRHEDRLRLLIECLALLTVPQEDVLSAKFWRLFGHTTRGLVCACETEYGPDNGFHQPQQLADIAGYYLAFGLSPLGATDVRSDHIACECEFMDFLNRKQAHLLTRLAAETDLAETVEATTRAARTFLRDHLGRFGRAFATRVVAEDGDGYFGTLGRVLLGFLEEECAQAEVDIGPVDLIVRPDESDETPIACGSANELIQIQRHP